MKRILLIIAGSLSVALAMLGLFLPLLPTTPFLLLAAACFFRSSDKLYNWLLNHRWFGSYIRNYREKRAIPLIAKISTMITLWGTLIISAFLFEGKIWAISILALVGIGVTYHVLRFKTLDAKVIEESKD